MSIRMPITATRQPTVTPAIPPGLNPPESLNGEAEEEAGGKGGPGTTVVVEGIPVLVALGAEFVVLGEALTLSASRSAARRLKLLFVSEMSREAQEGSSIAPGIGLGYWPIAMTVVQFNVHVV